jgi:hypothetical protein
MAWCLHVIPEGFCSFVNLTLHFAAELVATLTEIVTSVTTINVTSQIYVLFIPVTCYYVWDKCWHVWRVSNQCLVTALRYVISQRFTIRISVNHTNRKDSSDITLVTPLRIWTATDAYGTFSIIHIKLAISKLLALTDGDMQNSMIRKANELS